MLLHTATTLKVHRVPYLTYYTVSAVIRANSSVCSQFRMTCSLSFHLVVSLLTFVLLIYKNALLAISNYDSCFASLILVAAAWSSNVLHRGDVSTVAVHRKTNKHTMCNILEQKPEQDYIQLWQCIQKLVIIRFGIYALTATNVLWQIMTHRQVRPGEQHIVDLDIEES